MLSIFRKLVFDFNVKMEEAIGMCSTTPAKIAKLGHVGGLEQG